MNNQPILIAEDDADDRYLLQTAFSEIGYPEQIDFVENGVELINYLHEIYSTDSNIEMKALPGFILLDLNMPKKDGREVLKEIKQHPVFKKIPVIVFTTTKNEIEIKRCYELGANSYIQKPVDFDQFLSALDPQTRAELQTLIQQAGGGLQGQQETINDLLAQLNGLSQESMAPLSTFHQHTADLDRIIANLGIVSDRLAQSHRQLGDLVGSMSDVTGTLASNDQALASLILHLGNVMGDFNATLAGNEKNFHTTIVTLDPLLSQLNGTLTIVYGDSQAMIGQVNTNNRVLQPELVSATSITDGDGNILRQFFVADAQASACDTADGKQSSGCQTGAGTASQAPVLVIPALPTLPKLPLPKCLPTPTPPKLPTPTVSLPCPSLSPLPTPTAPCMPTPTPTPPKVPTPSPSVSLCPSVPGVSLPLGSLPDWLSLLLGGVQ